MKSSIYNIALFAILVVIECLLGGCFGRLEYNELTLPPPLVKPEKEVRLKAGDNISLVFYYNPDFLTIQTIREDGKIFLNLIGEVDAEGLTPLELKHKIEKEYHRYVDRVSASVVINAIAPKKIYMCGAVSITQLLGYRGDLSVFQAIVRSGGARGSARLDNVLVIRNQGTLAPLVFKVNVKDTIHKKGRDFVLENNDVVYIPTRVITKVNQFVAEYIDGVIPRHVSVGLGYSLGGISPKGEAEVDINVNGF